MFASVCAIARAFPLYSRKSCSQTKRTVYVEFVLVGDSDMQTLSANELGCMCDTAEGVRMAARITDIPCADMHTDAFVEVCMRLLQQCRKSRAVHTHPWNRCPIKAMYHFVLSKGGVNSFHSVPFNLNSFCSIHFQFLLEPSSSMKVNKIVCHCMVQSTIL